MSVVPEFVEVAHGSARYRQLVALRTLVLRMPLGLQFTAEQLASEREDIHLAAILDDEVVGCILITRDEDTAAKFRQMAVAPGQQRQGLGALLLAQAERMAREKGYEDVLLHARETAVGFYQKASYAVVGEPFIEVTLPHRKMWKDLR